MSKRVLTCVYCGHEYPQETPAYDDKVLTDHIAGCKKHPMRAVVEQRDKLRDALAGMIGATTLEELDALEVVVRSLPGREDDRAAALNAINALRACAV